jgi:hypothetical protein
MNGSSTSPQMPMTAGLRLQRSVDDTAQQLVPDEQEEQHRQRQPASQVHQVPQTGRAH